LPGPRDVRVADGCSLGWAERSQVLLALLFVACTGDRIVVGGRLPPVISELVDGDAGVDRDGGTSTSGVGMRAQCPESPGERRELIGCWPTRQVGRWQGFWLGLPRYETAIGEALEFPPGDVVMRFGDDGAGTFTVGESSPAAPAACGPDLDAGACAPVGELLGGFGYRLEQIRLQDAGQRGIPRVAGEPLPRAGELMAFELRLGQPWDGSCTGEAPLDCVGAACPAARLGRSSVAGEGLTSPVTCRCGAEQCVADAPTLALSLTMSDDGQALRGAYRPRDARLPAVGLELVKQREP
jgi:hypothetical protein